MSIFVAYGKDGMVVSVYYLDESGLTAEEHDFIDAHIDRIEGRQTETEDNNEE